MPRKGYQEVSQHMCDSEYECSSVKHIPSSTIDAKQLCSRNSVYILSSLLLSLVFTNLFMVCYVVIWRDASCGPATSTFVNLARDVPTELIKNTSFNHVDRAIEDAAWASPIVQANIGVVALEDSLSESLKLPHSMRWPWDDSKGVYIMASSHEMHCVQMLRKTISEGYAGDEMKLPRWHSLHCLDVLRQSIMCNADDTPLYTGRLHKESSALQPYAGIGMTRMCRSWDKLQAWNRQHSACYSAKRNPQMTERDQYKYCPDGSHPWES